MNDRALELDDIQGELLGGFNTDFKVLVGLTIASPIQMKPAAEWLAKLAGEVTSARKVQSERDFMKAAPAAAESAWLAVAIGQRLLSATQTDFRLEDAFNQGLVSHAAGVLGDRTDPDAWTVGSRPSPLDILFIVGANNKDAANGRADQIEQAAGKLGLSKSYRETGQRLNDAEHFGFRDGVSQPNVSGYDSEPAMAAGNFIFGYPLSKGGDPFVPAVDPRNLADNGSLLVFRRLNQDVAAFRTFCDAEAARLQPQWNRLSSRHLAALLVGRWPSGAPVKISQSEDPGASPVDNEFDFADDPEAAICPFGAHIRKVNPRKGRSDRVDVPRILRRGIPFGPRSDDDPAAKQRGLLFLAFQTSISGQFEFLSQHWMNSAQNPGPGFDLLVGRSTGNRQLKIQGPNGPVTISDGGRQWITPSGGGYLFAPGKRALAKFNTPRAAIGLWKAKLLLAQTKDLLKNTFTQQID